MRIRKSTWILLCMLVFVILGVGFFEYRRAQALKSAQGDQPPILPNWTADNVFKITVKYNEDRSTLQFMRDKNNNWVYVDRQSNTMPQDEINTTLTELFALTPTQKIEQGTPVSWLGLSPPVASFDVMNISGEEKLVKIGNASPVRTGYYLQVDNETPVIVPYNDVIQILDRIYLKIRPATWITPLVQTEPSISSTAVVPLPFQNP